MITLQEVTKENWFDVVLLRSAEDQKNGIFERDIASNCLSIAQASVEGHWTTKTIYAGDTLIGLTMYGYSEELQGYELCRIMIDYKFQGKGYGKQALKTVMECMINHNQCEEILLAVHPENDKAISLYKSVGFTNTGRTVKAFVDEHIYSYIKV